MAGGETCCRPGGGRGSTVPGVVWGALLLLLPFLVFAP
jgi:hypothetical protein